MPYKLGFRDDVNGLSGLVFGLRSRCWVGDFEQGPSEGFVPAPTSQAPSILRKEFYGTAMWNRNSTTSNPHRRIPEKLGTQGDLAHALHRTLSKPTSNALNTKK